MDNSTLDFIADNLFRVQARIQTACSSVGRTASDITVVAVTKSFPPEFQRKAYALGLRHFGENRVQEAIIKFGDRWERGDESDGILHLIGPLQSNKVRKAAELFTTVDCIDSIEVAQKLDGAASELGRQIRVLIEVNTTGEPQKHGFSQEEASEAARKVLELPHLDLAGLMTVGPMTDDTEAIQSSFRDLKRLFDQIAARLNPPRWSVLSMGMSHDFELAIAEGATEIRIGTGLFGQRD